MSSPIGPLSYLYPLAYPHRASPSAAPASGSGTGAAATATAELQAIKQQGNSPGILNDSLAAALLQPATGVNSGAAMSSLINNMLQQVLGAYRGQKTGPEQTKSS